MTKTFQTQPSRLVFTRPLVFIDLETTGLDVRQDRIVEIALLRMVPPGSSGIAPEPVVHTQRLNPGIPIPAEATRVHGLSDADVAGEPAFADVARSLFDFLSGCDFAGFGLRRFDLPILGAEFERAGYRFDYRKRLCVDGKEIFHFKEPRTLSAAYALYCGGELRSAHSAEADMIASRDVLLGILEHYQDLPATVEALSRIGAPQPAPEWLDAEGKLRWDGDEAVLNFGKHKGRRLRELAYADRGLLEWILARDFAEDVKRCVREALAGRFPVRAHRVSGTVELELAEAVESQGLLVEDSATHEPEAPARPVSPPFDAVEFQVLELYPPMPDEELLEASLPILAPVPSLRSIGSPARHARGEVEQIALPIPLP